MHDGRAGRRDRLYKLVSEEYLTQTIDGQKYSFQTNPSVEQSIKVERISDYCTVQYTRLKCAFSEPRTAMYFTLGHY